MNIPKWSDCPLRPINMSKGWIIFAIHNQNSSFLFDSSNKILINLFFVEKSTLLPPLNQVIQILLRWPRNQTGFTLTISHKSDYLTPDHGSCQVILSTHVHILMLVEMLNNIWLARILRPTFRTSSKTTKNINFPFCSAEKVNRENTGKFFYQNWTCQQKMACDIWPSNLSRKSVLYMCTCVSWLPLCSFTKNISPRS